MFGSSSQSTTKTDISTNLSTTAPEHRFNIIYLKALYAQLVENKIVRDENEKLVVEILRIIAEMTVYGDSKSEILFEFVCEKNMMALFLEIMMQDSSPCPTSVQIQILQTLSIMISCIHNNTSLYYLFSNNYINHVIMYPFNLKSDESLRDHYVSFLKTLSMRLNTETINFFSMEESYSFPLLSQAIKLLSIDENMSKIAAQTIILNIYQIKDTYAQRFSLQPLMVKSLCKKIVSIMVNQYKNIVCKLYESKSNEVNYSDRNYVSFFNQTSDSVASFDDWLFYVVDIFSLKIPELSKALIKIILDEFTAPYLFQPFIESAAVDHDNDQHNELPDNEISSSDCCENSVTISPSYASKHRDKVMDLTSTSAAGVNSNKTSIFPVIVDYIESSSETSHSKSKISRKMDSGGIKSVKTIESAPVQPSRSQKASIESLTIDKSSISRVAFFSTEFFQRTNFLQMISPSSLNHHDSDDDDEGSFEDGDNDESDDAKDEGFGDTDHRHDMLTFREFKDSDFYPSFESNGKRDVVKEYLKMATSVSFLTRMIRILPEFELQLQLMTSTFHPLDKLTLFRILKSQKIRQSYVDQLQHEQRQQLTHVSVSYEENPIQEYFFSLLNNFSNSIADMSLHYPTDNDGLNITEFLRYQHARQTLFLLVIRLLRIAFESPSCGNFAQRVQYNTLEPDDMSKATNSLCKYLNQYLCLYTCVGIFPVSNGETSVTFDYLSLKMDEKQPTTTRPYKDGISTEQALIHEITTDSGKPKIIVGAVELNTPHSQTSPTSRSNKQKSRGLINLADLEKIMSILNATDFTSVKQNQSLIQNQEFGDEAETLPTEPAIAVGDSHLVSDEVAAGEAETVETLADSIVKSIIAEFESHNGDQTPNVQSKVLAVGEAKDSVDKQQSKVHESEADFNPFVTTPSPSQKHELITTDQCAMKSQYEEPYNEGSFVSIPLFNAMVKLYVNTPVASVMVYQEIIHALYALIKLAYYSCFDDSSSSQVVSGERSHNYHNNLSKNTEGALPTFTIFKTPLVILRNCVEIIHEALGKFTSTILPCLANSSSVVFEPALDCAVSKGASPEVLLDLVLEEVHRLHLKRWSLTSCTTTGDINLLISITPSMRDQFRHFAHIDPTSNSLLQQREVLRAQVQRFLLLRSLYNRISKLLTHAEKGEKVEIEDDDLSLGVVDEYLLQFAGMAAVPKEIRAGMPINMRGKKFLDAATYLPATIGPIGSKIVVSDNTSTLNNTNVNLNAQLRRQSDPGATPSPSSSSMFDYLKNSTAFSMSFRSPNSNTSSLGNTYTASSSRVQANTDVPADLAQSGATSGSRRLSEVLLVQDPTVLLLVRPTNSIDFEVLLSIPIFQIVANVYPHQRTKIRVIVKSWDKISDMLPDVETSESPITSPVLSPRLFPVALSSSSTSSATVTPPKKSLKIQPPRTFKMFDDVINKDHPTDGVYEIMLVFENENSCNLALKYLQSKSNAMREAKFNSLKSLLSSP